MDSVPECSRCGDRWVDGEQHWRWEALPLTADHADDEQPLELLPVAVLAWCCPTCWPQARDAVSV